MMCNKLTYLFLVLVSLFFSMSASAACTNIIKNKSRSPWFVNFTAYQNPPVAPYLSSRSGFTAEILPGSSLKVRLYNASLYISFFDHADIEMVDRQGVMHKFYFHNTECPYLFHNGRTGSVSLNEPNQGDITIEKDTWDSAS